MNKSFQKKILKHAGIDVPKDILLSIEQVETISEKELLVLLEKEKILLPVVVKPSHEGSSVGISVVFDKILLFMFI